MANILFLAHRIPYPPNKGDKIRSWNFLAHLTSKHTVHLGFFVDDEKDLVHIDYLKSLSASLCFEKVNPLFQKAKSLSGLLTGQALTVSAYPYRKLSTYTDALIKTGEVDLIFLFSAATGPIVPKGCETPVITDLVDVDSQKWKSYSEEAIWPLSWIYRREAQQLEQYEQSLTDRSKYTALVSEQEAALFQSVTPNLSSKIKAIPNGVDLTAFDPASMPEADDNNVVLFTGAMNYQPNIEAVIWFYNEIWPNIRAKNNKAVFRIAGGPAVPKVQALASTSGVEVLGYVDDMAVEISKATVCVAPLRTARGIQNKVLEAMAMAKPVVATSLANEGINGVSGVDLIEVDTADELATAVLRLLEDTETRKTIGQAARTFVQLNFTWDTAFEKLDNLIGESL